MTCEAQKIQAANDIAHYSKLCFNRFLVRAAGGNLSVRLPDDQGFMVTPTGVSLRVIDPQTLIVVDASGDPVGGPTAYRPSKETMLHLCIYAMFPWVKAVIHVHPPHATAFALNTCHLPLVTSQASIQLYCVPVADYAVPGTKALVDNIERALRDAPGDTRAILLENHGVVAFGDGLEDAFNTADLVEESSQIAFIRKVIYD